MMRDRIAELRYLTISGFLMAIGLAAHSPAAATTIRVPADQPTIQAGINAASSGDEVLVAQGTYTGAGNKNLDLLQKDIVVRSESGADVTIIDCQGSGRGFMLFGAYPASTRIEGFTIQNGNGNGEPVGGGGMVIGGGAATIRSCVFRSNVAAGANLSGGGGGLACHNASSLIEDCEFIQNSVLPNTGAVGGGLASHDGTPIIRGCRFIENLALGGGGGGGGMYVHLIAPTPGVVIEECELLRNRASSGGGGVVSGARVSNCTVESNEGNPGVGGMALSQSIMENCSITDNSSANFGGGVAAFRSTMSDCLLARNTAVRGGGIWASDASTIERCVVLENQADIGGGLYGNGVPSSSVIRCTFVRNSAQEGSGIAISENQPVIHRVDATIVVHGMGGPAIACLGAATIDASCNDLFGNVGGDWVGCVAGQFGKEGNFSADPVFCDPGANDFTLTENSPCMPGLHPKGFDCGAIGAKEQGCSTVAVEATTWGKIKTGSWMPANRH